MNDQVDQVVRPDVLLAEIIIYCNRKHTDHPVRLEVPPGFYIGKMMKFRIIDKIVQVIIMKGAVKRIRIDHNTQEDDHGYCARVEIVFFFHSTGLQKTKNKNKQLRTEQRYLCKLYFGDDQRKEL